MFCLAAFAWISFLRRQVAMQTQQLRLANERLTDLSTRDPLTHAFNRRRFDEILDIELRRSRRSGRPLSLVMADIDYFKSPGQISVRKGGVEVSRIVGLREGNKMKSGTASAFGVLS
jgi:PleD family two-component response regulator